MKPCSALSSSGFVTQGDELEETESEVEDESLPVPHETLEDDEELRMHILGLNSCYTKFLDQIKTCPS